jgi:hypothetical protein
MEAIDGRVQPVDEAMRAQTPGGVFAVRWDTRGSATALGPMTFFAEYCACLPQLPQLPQLLQLPRHYPWRVHVALSLSGILRVRHSMTQRSMNAPQDEHRCGGQSGAAAVFH